MLILKCGGHGRTRCQRNLMRERGLVLLANQKKTHAGQRTKPDRLRLLSASTAARLLRLRAVLTAVCVAFNSNSALHQPLAMQRCRTQKMSGEQRSPPIH